jgi:hypothetical protein
MFSTRDISFVKISETLKRPEWLLMHLGSRIALPMGSCSPVDFSKEFVDFFCHVLLSMQNDFC